MLRDDRWLNPNSSCPACRPDYPEVHSGTPASQASAQTPVKQSGGFTPGSQARTHIWRIHFISLLTTMPSAAAHPRQYPPVGCNGFVAKAPSKSVVSSACQDLADVAVDLRRVNSWVDQLPAADAADMPPGRLPVQHRASDEVGASTTSFGNLKSDRNAYVSSRLMTRLFC